jgi:hypothetical protein
MGNGNIPLCNFNLDTKSKPSGQLNRSVRYTLPPLSRKKRQSIQTLCRRDLSPVVLPVASRCNVYPNSHKNLGLETGTLFPMKEDVLFLGFSFLRGLAPVLLQMWNWSLVRRLLVSSPNGATPPQSAPAYLGFPTLLLIARLLKYPPLFSLQHCFISFQLSCH